MQKHIAKNIGKALECKIQGQESVLLGKERLNSLAAFDAVI